MIIALLIIETVILIICFIVIFRHQFLLKDRAQLMHDAIRHRDFSFHLPIRGLLFGERALQKVLNAMGQDIEKLVAHNEVESWQRLARVLTHEIMNSTTPIRGISQAYLSMPEIKGTIYEEGIQAIHDTSVGLATFVENYRKLTQLQEPVIRDIDILSFCTSIMAVFPNLHWDMDIPANSRIRADETLLRQVFINLARNAVEADAKGMGIRYIPSTNTILISNNGHVIPDAVAREIFVPFFTTKKSGSGIGLSLSRQILMMQHFSLSLQEHPVSGYNVTFRIESER